MPVPENFMWHANRLSTGMTMCVLHAPTTVSHYIRHWMPFLRASAFDRNSYSTSSLCLFLEILCSVIFAAMTAATAISSSPLPPINIPIIVSSRNSLARYLNPMPQSNKAVRYKYQYPSSILVNIVDRITTFS